MKFGFLKPWLCILQVFVPILPSNIEDEINGCLSLLHSVISCSLSLVSIIFDRSESISTYYFPIFLNNCPANSCHFYMNLASRCALLCPQPEGKHTVKNLPTCYNLPWDYTLDCTAMPITSQANKIKRFVLLLCKVTLQSLNQDTFDVSGSYGSC